MENRKEPRFIVVVGTSAGGLHSLIELTAQLDEDMDIAVFAVLHLNKLSMTEVLVKRLQSVTSLRCKMAEDGEKIKSRHLYLAPPNLHLLLKKGEVILGQGATENRWRPSIDMLFRSAATVYNSKVIGIILTGLMQDGTAGMDAIKKCGGTLVVQDPSEAEFPDMPQSVLQNMEVDYCISLTQMGALLKEKLKGTFPAETPVPEDLKKEAGLSEKVATTIETLSEIGEYSQFSCPDCGGGLYRLHNDSINHYKCHVGHSYTEGELFFQMTNSLEATLWVALRMMEERRLLLKKMSEEEKGKGWVHSAAQKKEREQEIIKHIERLKEILFASQPNNIQPKA